MTYNIIKTVTYTGNKSKTLIHYPASKAYPNAAFATLKDSN